MEISKIMEVFNQLGRANFELALYYASKYNLDEDQTEVLHNVVDKLYGDYLNYHYDYGFIASTVAMLIAEGDDCDDMDELADSIADNA